MQAIASSHKRRFIVNDRKMMQKIIKKNPEKKKEKK